MLATLMKLIHGYGQAKRKKYVQQKVLDMVAGIKSSATVLLGPTCKDYLLKIAKYIACSKEARIYSYEIDWNSYCLQWESISELQRKDSKKIILNFQNVIDCKVNRFIDLDLMCTIINGENIIRHVFVKQYEIYKTCNERKVFNFTLSIRGNNPENIFAFIEKLLNLKIKKKFTSTNDYCIEYTFIHDSSEFFIKAWSYRDTSPMLNFLIQY